MHGEVGGGTREAGVAEFLDYDRVVPKVSASTAKFFGNLRAKQAGLAAGTPKGPLDDARILPALEIGCDLRCSKAPHSLPELVVLFVINRAVWKHHGTPVCIDDLATAASMLDRCWTQNATLSPPLSSRISRASSAVAMSNPSPSMIFRTCLT